jgi:putative acetyltransferase
MRTSIHSEFTGSSLLQRKIPLASAANDGLNLAGLQQVPDRARDQGAKMEIRIRIDDPEQPQVLRMLADSHAYYAALYPAASNHLLDVASLKQNNASFYTAAFEGVVRGFGAIINCGPEYGEIKRMYVDPAARGMGIGRRILGALERHALADGLACLRLETGVRQPEAIALYRSCGYSEIGPFGHYLPDPLSMFMEKQLGGPAAPDNSA